MISTAIEGAIVTGARDEAQQAGLPMSTAVDLFLNQIVLTGGLPFAVTLPDVPENIDTAK